MLVAMVIRVGLAFRSAGVAGKWMQDNVIAPIFEAFLGEGRRRRPQADRGEQTGAAGGVEELYAPLRADGRFFPARTTPELVCSAERQGAAGYRMTASGNVRVLVSAYPDKQDAPDTCATGSSTRAWDCTVYTFTCLALEITVTADKTRIPEIRSSASTATRPRWSVAESWLSRWMTAQCRRRGGAGGANAGPADGGRRPEH